MAVGRFVKSPEERKRYVIDYTDWLDTAETVSSATILISPTGGGSDLVVDAQSILTGGKQLAIFVNDGVAGTTYEVTVRISTSIGQIKEDQVVFTVRDL